MKKSPYEIGSGPKPLRVADLDDSSQNEISEQELSESNRFKRTSKSK
jgi:hypothetical protein